LFADRIASAIRESLLGASADSGPPRIEQRGVQADIHWTSACRTTGSCAPRGARQTKN